MTRKLRMGMVGGGRDAFIGAVHRMAAALDGLIELSCGAFSSNPEKSRASGKDLFLPENRIYADYREMFEAESRLPADERMDFVAIVTPNHLHYDIAVAALDHGFSVMCEKPMTFHYEQALMLREKVHAKGLLFGLTHNYTGYPLVKEARAQIASGRFGTIRKVVVEYPQGWLASPIETSGQKQASWRTDPTRAGASCCVGDIGTHAANLAEYVTGLRIESVLADTTTFVGGRELEDDANVLLRFEGKAKGILHASQIAVDEENALSIRVYGERGGLEWHQQEPNSLWLKWPDQPRQLLRAGANYARLSPEARFHLRLPAGHPEGFIEAFANLYRDFALTLGYRLGVAERVSALAEFPDVEAGVRGMAFIQSVTRSAENSQWVSLPTTAIKEEK